MKKIGICTLYQSYNFGAILQAYSMQEILKKNGYQVEFLKFKGENKERFIFLKSKNPIKMLNNFLQLSKFNEDFKKFNIAKEYYDNEKEYDAIIIGSDELWNINNPSFNHRDEYFGLNLNSKKVISYAPSCNNVTKAELLNFNKNYNFKKITHLSGRDENTLQLIKDITGMNAQLVLDPTFIYDDFYKYVKDVPEEKFIAIYGYEFKEEQINQIKSFAQKRNLETISLGLYNKWCDKNVKINSFEFLSYMAKADFVMTSTFHGTIFSILLEKDFITFSNNKNKIKFLLKEFNIEQRDFSNKNIELWDKYDINYNDIKVIKENLKKDSYNYLINAIEE